ncbi:hypothetical protein [Bifidobacterium animalis]|uniref:hypothetical protein n=1 Tax=Bifidobacterium animalis TaxID=28025 RepID=UPI000B12A246|nr:hypothetical protein [Bifidobacterium animalis]
MAFFNNNWVPTQDSTSTATPEPVVEPASIPEPVVEPEPVSPPDIPETTDVDPEPEVKPRHKPRPRPSRRVKEKPSLKEIRSVLAAYRLLDDEDFSGLLARLTGAKDEGEKVERILADEWSAAIKTIRELQADPTDMTRLVQVIKLQEKNPDLVKQVVKLLAVLADDESLKWTGAELDVAQTVSTVAPLVDVDRVKGLA